MLCSSTGAVRGLTGWLFWVVYTGTRPGVTPPSGRGRGGGDTGSLLPGVLPPNSVHAHAFISTETCSLYHRPYHHHHLPPAQGGIQILGGRLRFCYHAATSSSSSSCSFCFRSSTCVGHSVMLQRQVSAVLLFKSRCASFSGYGRPCDHTACVPAVL